MKTQLSSLYEKISKFNEELKLLYLTRDQIADYQTLYRAYNEIPSLLFEEAIPFIEEYTNKILDKIAPGRRVQLRAFKDTKARNPTEVPGRDRDDGDRPA